MSAAAVEGPHRPEPLPLLEEANKLMDQHPGYRVEIIGGVITVAPPSDFPHSRVLTKLMKPFLAAGLDGEETEIGQGVGVWLPTGPEDYAIPDLVVVDADIDDHVIEHNCYDPVAFRLVLEVTSSNYNNDLRNKVVAYAEAKIPVYVIVNRKHGRVHVLTDPAAGGYDTHRVHAPGEQITLPDSIGAKVTLDVAELLAAGQHKG
ncbi:MULTISPECIES: Uma2 family endonuclease [unclassified Streptomyces]|uniref:Uma2 family endonuclease n=1 Tax=unclassified Streptomyces TaxID=2593676 RepID=UPI00168A7282|nr:MULTISPECIES: Uma2 family endonuclease [unclassified Streptomyces]MBD3011104.1 Uma2 family endonuclease [Streptomyces sp. 5-10]